MLKKKEMAMKPCFNGRSLGSVLLWMVALILVGSLVLESSAVLAEPVTLKFATTIPPSNPIVTEVFEPWAKKVNEASNGELNIQVISGPTLANPGNVWERTVSGVTEIGFGIHGAVGLPFPKSTVSSVPFVVDDLTTGSVGLWRLYEKGLIVDEHKDVRVLALVVTPGSLIASKKQVISLEDMKGLKVRAANKMVADIISALGGAPISVSAPETYQALQRGVVTASVAGWVLVNNFKFYEVVNYYLEGVPLGEPSGFVIMNRQAYDKLSPKAKETLDRFAGEPFSRDYGAWFKMDAARGRQRVASLPNQHIMTLTAQEKERWKKTLEPVVKDWVAKTPDGAKILETYRAEMKKVSQ
jgi:TRAP-type C4-dicarboxylate transport system substrate-binding protein